MPRNIQQAWSGPTVFAVDPPSAVVDGTLDVSGTPGIETLVAGGVLAGGTISPPGGTISLSIGAGLSNPAPGTIANSGVLAIAQGTLSATGTVTAGSGLTLTGTTLTATGGVTAWVAGAGITTSLTGTNGTITAGGTASLLETVVAQTGTAYAFAAADRANLITFSNAASIAATIAQAGTATFPAGFFADTLNLGAGYWTLTPTTSTINGTTKLMLARGQGARIVSDGTNYFALTSSLIAAVPSSTPTTPAFVSGWLDGLTRGPSAIDIQTLRTAFTYASGDSAGAIGVLNTAGGVRGWAVGYSNSAGGTDSIAIGISNTTTGFGDLSVAVGYSNTVSTGSSTAGRGTAVGVDNTVAAIDGGAFGSSNTAGNTTSSNTYAVGFQCTITGSQSIGLGYRAADRGNTGAFVRQTVNLGGSSSLLGRSQPEDYTLVAQGGVQALGSVIVSGGHIGSATLSNVGSGYSTTPNVVVTGDGAGATITAGVASTGTLTALNITNSGSGYTSATVTIDPPTMRLTTTGLIAAAGNVAALGTKSTQMFDCWLEVADTVTGDYVTWYLPSPCVVAQGTSAATTTMNGSNPAFTAGPSSVLTTGTPTITADTTNGGYNLSLPITAGNPNTLYAVAALRILNERHN